MIWGHDRNINMIFIFNFDKFGKITVILEIYFSAKNEYFPVHKNMEN